MITVSGNVVKPPTSMKTDDVLYANFNLVVNVGNVEIPKITWYAISASGKNAEAVLNMVNEGDKLFIIGKPSVDIYLGKEKQVVAVQKIWLEKFEFGWRKSVVLPTQPPSIEDTTSTNIENKTACFKNDEHDVF